MPRSIVHGVNTARRVESSSEEEAEPKEQEKQPKPKSKPKPRVIPPPSDEKQPSQGTVSRTRDVPASKPRGSAIRSLSMCDPPQQPVNLPPPPAKVAKAPPRVLVPKPEVTVSSPVDAVVGKVYTKSGVRDLWQTPSRRFYVVRDAGTKSYVTQRINTGKLEIFNEGK